MSFEKKSENPLDPLRQATEEEYFRKQNKELAAKIKERAQVAAAAGVKDEDLAKKLTAAGFNDDSVRALFIIPLIEVAWADGDLSGEEKSTVLNLVKARGISMSSEAFKLIDRWLKEPPSDDTYRKGKSLLEPLLQGVKKAGGQNWIIEACRQVAQATGGIFGFGNKISDEEAAVLQKIIDGFKS